MTTTTPIFEFLSRCGVPPVYLKETDKTKYSVPFTVLLKEIKNSGLYFCGEAGTGKTQLAVDLMAVLSEENKVELKTKDGWEYVDGTAKEKVELKKDYNPKLFRFFNVPKLLNHIRSFFSTEDDTVDRFLRELNEYEYLIFDDLAANKTSEWVLEILYLIVNDRYENLKKTIFTSNKTIQEIARGLDSRIASRILGMCKVVLLRGNDKRLEIKNINL